jgi:hypothetical protein
MWKSRSNYTAGRIFLPVPDADLDRDPPDAGGQPTRRIK